MTCSYSVSLKEETKSHAASDLDLREESKNARAKKFFPGKRVKHVIAIGGGKGGVGKSMISANLGLSLARRGFEVVMTDADLGGANLHTCLGISAPKTTLSDFIDRRVPKLTDLAEKTGIPKLRLISGALDYLNAANPKHSQKMRLLRELVCMDADCVVIDIGGGTGFNILDFFSVANHGILTVVPEPTSIENAYRFIKAVCIRRLKSMESAWGLGSWVAPAMLHGGDRGLKTPLQILEVIESRSPAVAQRLRRELLRQPFHLIVNQTRSKEEEGLGVGISAACRKHLGVPMNFLGTVPYDEAVWRSVRRRRPIVLDSPESSASLAIQSLLDHLALQA